VVPAAHAHQRTSATIHASLSAAVYHAPHGGCKDYRVIVDIVIAFLPHIDGGGVDSTASTAALTLRVIK
jgi:hypothetical protein